MADWYSIEIFDGDLEPASLWQAGYLDEFVTAALLAGAYDWAWRQHRWGVVFEVEFADDDAWERFRSLPAVLAALDAVPDPLSGLAFYRGRGGSGAGERLPRRPRPLTGSGACALPIPHLRFDLLEDAPIDRPRVLALR